MREAISVGEQLMVTLRFLATGKYKTSTSTQFYFNYFYYILGDSYVSLSYLFRIAANTICGIVPDVCQALSNVLQAKGFLKVNVTYKIILKHIK